jgi:ABC-2 type transport system ATP-binding protein
VSLKVEHLTKVFETQKAVDDISFEIQPGNIVGFLGPNGAGKSTTMKILTTFLPATSGKAFVCGFDVEKEPMEVRRNVGYLPEKNPLYYDMYVREFLEFTAGVHQLGQLKKSRVDEMIAITGLEKEVRKKIGSLSKGYKQRVGLAQAMIHHPKVLILDEPTSGLDPNQIVEVRELILNIGKERTVLLSTHIMQEVQAMCGRAIIINNGKIVADDKIENIQGGGTSTSTLCVELDRQVPAMELQVFEHAGTIKQVEPQRWLLQTSRPDLLRREIMAWSLEKDIAILTLKTESQSLEEAFRDLTKGS